MYSRANSRVMGHHTCKGGIVYRGAQKEKVDSGKLYSRAKSRVMGHHTCKGAFFVLRSSRKVQVRRGEPCVLR